MGRGISPLQQEVLDALGSFPALEDCPRTESGQVLVAALPALGAILAAMGRASTPVNRASVSRALDRLDARGSITKLRSTVAPVGGGYRYARISRAISGEVRQLKTDRMY